MLMGSDEERRKPLGTSVLPFGEKLTRSQSFLDLYREGMQLVENTAAYLDGPGRAQAHDLEQQVKLLFAAESMRLTTYLMQAASWLLIHRSLSEGEMSLGEVRRNRTKLDFRKSTQFAESSEFWDLLPADMLELIDRAKRLRKRVHMLDVMIHERGLEEMAAEPQDPVNQQIAMLEKAMHGLRIHD